MTTANLHAPSSHGQILLVPNRGQMAATLGRNQEILDTISVLIDGEPLCDFRNAARREAIQLAHGYFEKSGEPIPEFTGSRLLLSGHQPELFHVGVWFKNFVLNRTAKENGLVPLNLVVDNDTLKSASLRLPMIENPKAPQSVHYASLPFDKFEGETPFETREILDESLFASFAERAEAVYGNWGYRPLLPELWQLLRNQLPHTRRLSELFSRGRRHWERQWGVRNWELPLSALCESKSFHRFVNHLLSDLPRFHAIHNRVIRDYRSAHGIRSRNHPVPELGAEGDWLESPFWVLSENGSKRERPFVRRNKRLEFRIAGSIIEEPIRWRTRALTTTLFARICLGEGFIHGIGGAKYDEVADLILREWLGIDPPAYFVATATLHLPLAGFAADPQTLRDTQKQIRDLKWKPELFAEMSHPAIELKRRLIQSEPREHTARRKWFRELQSVTLELRSTLESDARRLAEIQAKLEFELNANAILNRRDYAWPLFPERMLHDFLALK